MDVTIDDRHADLIRERVEAGRNADAADVVREALDRLAEADRELAELRAAVRLGREDVEAGRFTEYSPDLLDEIFQRVIDQGRPPGHEVRSAE